MKEQFVKSLAQFAEKQNGSLPNSITTQSVIKGDPHEYTKWILSCDVEVQDEVFRYSEPLQNDPIATEDLHAAFTILTTTSDENQRYNLLAFVARHDRNGERMVSDETFVTEVLNKSLAQHPDFVQGIDPLEIQPYITSLGKLARACLTIEGLIPHGVASNLADIKQFNSKLFEQVIKTFHTHIRNIANTEYWLPHVKLKDAIHILDSFSPPKSLIPNDPELKKQTDSAVMAWTLTFFEATEMKKERLTLLIKFANGFNDLKEKNPEAYQMAFQLQKKLHAFVMHRFVEGSEDRTPEHLENVIMNMYFRDFSGDWRYRNFPNL